MNFDKVDGFDWDSGNINKNWERPTVLYTECEQTFFNIPVYYQIDLKHSRTEVRFVLYGKTNRGRLLTIIFTLRQNKIRVISARDQNKTERFFYLSKNYE